jgi:transcriptional regulator with GAF, ATPase, and Fis domain
LPLFPKLNSDAASENERLRQALGELQVLESIAQEAVAEQPLQETIDRITAKCVVCFGVEQGVIHLFEAGLPGKQWRTIVREAGTRASGQAYAPTDQLIGWALKNRGVLRLNDTAAESGALAAGLNAEGIRSLMAATLIFQGNVIGLLNLVNRKSAEPFTEEEERVLSLIATQSAQIIHAAQLIGELRQRGTELEEENRELALRLENARARIIGNSPALERILRLIDQIRNTDVDVLITGESGTGKELIARAVHDSSSRAQGPFVALNCAALPETLLETELFGVEKGVATGVEKRAGHFEAANGGTLFLDEIGDLGLAGQAKILRVLQERVIQRVGSRETVPVDVRIVTATNKNLEKEAQEGRFREDLHYRLKVIHLKMPALRERREDIPQLVSAFSQRFSREFQKPTVRFAPDALSALSRRDWPGNVRELQNEIKRLVICAVGPVVRLADLNDDASLLDPAKAGESSSGVRPLEESLAQFERGLLIEALRIHNGNQTETAKALGLSRPGLFKKLRRLGISSDRCGTSE